MQIHLVPTTETGTASALRDCRAKLNITNDFFVLPCDLVTDVSLSYVAGVHRFRKSTATLLYKAPPPPPLNTEVKKQIDPEDPSVEVVAIEDSTGRIAYSRAYSDVEDGLKLPKRVLKTCPNLVFSAMLTNSHVFLFRPCVFDLIAELKDASSLIVSHIWFLFLPSFC